MDSRATPATTAGAPPGLQRLVIATLAANVAVILWGAYVRASGSGAGCGNHWPLCNGEVVPRSPSAETLVELTHRVTSGLALLLVLAMTVWVFRACAKGHPARGAAIAATVLILVEAAIGAGLVLLELVAENESMARAAIMAFHLLNTFLLLAALTATAYWIGGGRPAVWRPRGWRIHGPLIAMAALMVVGASGAVAALGDTLFPATSLSEAIRQDLSPTAHVLVRLRVLHPFLAVGATLFLLYLPRLVDGQAGRRLAPGLGAAVSLAALAQLGLGAANVALLAPVWMQLAHLLLADLLWILLVLYGLVVAASPP